MLWPATQKITLLILLLTSSAVTIAASPKKPARPGFENELFRIRVITRTPNQITAFYTGRGFPQKALDELRKVCFITIGMGNKGKQRVGLDLNQWSLETSDGQIKRILRPDWRKRWAKIGLEKRFQSTFRWTLMPEKLDFFPYEGEGGNLTIPYTDKPITLKAKVPVGDDDKQIYDVEINNIRCELDK